MALPLVTVRARVLSQDGKPVAGAIVAALLDRTETYDGVVVPSRQRAVADSAGLAELAVFPNDAGVAGSSYTVAIYNAAGGLLYQTRAVFPSSDAYLDLYACADNPVAPAISLTEQQMRDIRAARAGIDAVSEQARADVKAAGAAADSAADSLATIQRIRPAIGQDRAVAVAARNEATAAATQATRASESAARSADAAAQAREAVSDDAERVRQSRIAAEQAASSAANTADELEQLYADSLATVRITEAQLGRPLLLYGDRY